MRNLEMLFIVPSRGRPNNIAELIAEWDETSGVADLLVAVDNDDKRKVDYEEIEKQTEGTPGILPFYYGPRLRLGPTLNKLAIENASKYWSLGFMGDDHRPRTVGWDIQYLKALTGMGTGMVYGDDLLQGRNIPTQIAMTSDIVEAMGYMVPPKCTHLYFDNMWKVVGSELGRLIYLPSVVVEHMHPLAGKSDVDDGYVEVNSAEMYAHDEKEFKTWLAQNFQDAISRIQKVML